MCLLWPFCFGCVSKPSELRQRFWASWVRAAFFCHDNSERSQRDANTAVVSRYIVTHILEVNASITCISSVPGACEVDLKHTHTHTQSKSCVSNNFDFQHWFRRLYFVLLSSEKLFILLTLVEIKWLSNRPCFCENS